MLGGRGFMWPNVGMLIVSRQTAILSVISGGLWGTNRQDFDIIRSDAVKLREMIADATAKDPPFASQLLRLAFHDAAPHAPNGSIQYELDWPENRGLRRPLERLHELWSATTVLSFADAVALAGSEAVSSRGGPSIPIRVGRKDAAGPDPARRGIENTAVRGSDRFSQDNLLHNTLPSPGLNSDGLRRYFSSLGLTEAEFVALCGCHAMGRHITLLGMPKACLKSLTAECLENAPTSVPFVSSSVDNFDNSYFQYLLQWDKRQLQLGEASFIPTDVALVVDGGLRKHVERYATNQELYFQVFKTAFRKVVEPGSSSTFRC